MQKASTAAGRIDDPTRLRAMAPAYAAGRRDSLIELPTTRDAGEGDEGQRFAAALAGDGGGASRNWRSNNYPIGGDFEAAVVYSPPPRSPGWASARHLTAHLDAKGG